MYCTSCGAALEAGAQFCTGCGIPVAAIPVAAVAAASSAEPAASKPPPARTEEEFRSFYQKVLLPDLIQIDRERHAVQGRILVVWLVTAALVVLVLGIGSLLE